VIRVVIVGAGARGNRVFADLIARYDTGFEVVGVVEPVEAKRRAFQQRCRVPDTRAHASIEAFLDTPRYADIVFICTLDPTHYELCRAVSQGGYDVLLEKPIATNLPDCLALLDVEAQCRNRILVAHVLRYAPFFQTVKAIIGSGRFGAVRDIQLAEHIGHWHYAHSYVRGSWNRVDRCAPIILTKCSHDLDLLPWLVGERVTAVASTGGLTSFRRENAPPGSAERCVDCGLAATCIYDATRFYVNDRAGWPHDVIAPPPDSIEARRDAVATGPYGRCVWRCDNDVCDHQTVTLEFASGLHATLGMHANTADNSRRITVLFDEAEVTGELYRHQLSVSKFTGMPDVEDIEVVPLPDLRDRHGGGDLGLLLALRDSLNGGGDREILTSLRSSVLSHVLAFLAEDSRGANAVKIPLSESFVPDPLLDGARIGGGAD